jgi:hypothetical protein
MWLRSHQRLTVGRIVMATNRLKVSGRMLLVLVGVTVLSMGAMALGAAYPDWYYAHSDSIEQAAIDTNRKISTYEASQDPYVLSEWLVNGPSEGPRQEMYIIVAGWGVDHPTDFIRVIDAIDSSRRAEFAEVFAAALGQSSADERFRAAFVGRHSKALDEVMKRL